MINFLNSCLNLVISFLDSDLLFYWFYPCFCLAFLATFPAIVRCFTRWR